MSPGRLINQITRYQCVIVTAHPDCRVIIVISPVNSRANIDLVSFPVSPETNYVVAP